MPEASQTWDPPDDYPNPPAERGLAEGGPSCLKIQTVRDVLGPSFPRIVCLIGADSGEAAEREARAGRIVLFRTRQLAPPTHDTDERLDDLHLQMIDLADEVLVLNLGGVVGYKTGNALAYALALGKPVRTLESLDLEKWRAERDPGRTDKANRRTDEPENGEGRREG